MVEVSLWVGHAAFDPFIQIGNDCVAVDVGDARVSNMELHIPSDLGYSRGILLSRSQEEECFLLAPQY